MLSLDRPDKFLERNGGTDDEVWKRLGPFARFFVRARYYWACKNRGIHKEEILLLPR